MDYFIESIVSHGAAIKEFRLVPADGSAAPAWSAGAHIELDIRSQSGSSYRNAYSLVGEPGQHLRIAVQREETGRGGSRVLHDEYIAGMMISASAPLATFALRTGSARNVLIAGGIGITPMVSMARALDHGGNRFELHYLARDPARLVLLHEVENLSHGQLATYTTGSGGRPDMQAVIGAYTEGSELHACGPGALLEAIRTAATAMGWPAANVHFESFGARSASTDRPIKLYLRQSDMHIDVAPGTSILDAMIAADAFVSYDCKRGECGHCFANVTAGEAIHRDVCLTPEQRGQGMTTCVSWATGDDLELDL